MKTLFFADIDQTLVSTLRRCTHLSQAELQNECITGKIVSTPQQRELFSQFAQFGTFIPVTSRNSKSFSTILLDFSGPAVVSFGAHILLTDQKTLDSNWEFAMSPYRESISQNLQNVSALLHSEFSSDKVDVRMVSDFERPVYISLVSLTKTPRQKENALQKYLKPVQKFLQKNKLDSEFYICNNGRQFSIIPMKYSKRAAVGYLLAQYSSDESLLTIGLGDSLADVPFMGYCDFVMSPTDSQIVNSLTRSVQKQCLL